MKGPPGRMFRTRGGRGSSLLLGLAVAVMVTLAPSAGARAGNGNIDTQLTAGWQRTEDSWRQHGPLPGITAAVQLSDGSTWKGVSGAARLPPNHIPATPDTPFLIASVTKTFVASTVLELVHDGKLSLRDPLSKWMPNFDRADRITVRMLLAHTSGIADIFDSPAFNRLVLKRPDHVWTFDEILSMVGAPHFAPGRSLGILQHQLHPAWQDHPDGDRQRRRPGDQAALPGPARLERHVVPGRGDEGLADDRRHRLRQDVARLETVGAARLAAAEHVRGHLRVERRGDGLDRSGPGHLGP